MIDLLLRQNAARIETVPGLFELDRERVRLAATYPGGRIARRVLSVLRESLAIASGVRFAALRSAYYTVQLTEAAALAPAATVDIVHISADAVQWHFEARRRAGEVV